jgi:hypothetical protein
MQVPYANTAHIFTDEDTEFTCLPGGVFKFTLFTTPAFFSSQRHKGAKVTKGFFTQRRVDSARRRRDTEVFPANPREIPRKAWKSLKIPGNAQ